MKNSADQRVQPVAAFTAAHLYTSRNVLGQSIDLDAVLDRIVLEWLDLMAIGRALQKCVLDHAAEFSSHTDEPSCELAAEWRNEARSLNDDAGRLRELIVEAQGKIPEFAPIDDAGAKAILSMMGQWSALTGEIADLMEDLAETMALSAHEPFREMVKTELEVAGIA